MPFHRSEILTSLDPNGINKRLSAHRTTVDWLGRAKTGGTLTGRIDGGSFRLKYVSAGRDYFNPTMYGRYRATRSGTSVSVLMTLPPWVWIVILFATYSFVDSAIESVKAKGALDPMPILILVFVWGMTIFFFMQNVRRNEKLLAEYLKGKVRAAVA